MVVEKDAELVGRHPVNVPGTFLQLRRHGIAQQRAAFPTEVAQAPARSQTPPPKRQIDRPAREFWSC